MGVDDIVILGISKEFNTTFNCEQLSVILEQGNELVTNLRESGKTDTNAIAYEILKRWNKEVTSTGPRLYAALRKVSEFKFIADMFENDLLPQPGKCTRH